MPDNQPSVESLEIDRLAMFLLNEFPHEIGRGDPQNGESAVDVAIRLLSDKPYKVADPASGPDLPGR